MTERSAAGQGNLARSLVRLESVTTVYRPLQYLGTKLRSLDQITDAVQSVAPRGARVLDLFTGSTVVAQALAQSGFCVTATDALEFSAVIARAVLGISRDDARWSDDFVNTAMSDQMPEWAAAWSEWVQAEDEAVAVRDGQRLLELSQTVPQVWRANPESLKPTRQLNMILESAGDECPRDAGIAVTHYAGTYFGVRQALEIDVILERIRLAHRKGEIGDWQRDVALTALLGAASKCAFSAGKHFAQPHLIREDKDLTFARRRVVDDRSQSVFSLFGEGVDRIVALDFAAGPHAALHARLEELSLAPEKLGDVAVVYADPPYTAQQYSRFYHVPEVLLGGVVPVLQLGKFGVTRGLYPEDRFKSRFCSKRQAPRAFADLVNFARRLDATLLISYSGSSTGQTGNARMVTLDDICQLARVQFSRVSVSELDHSYRQFNHSSSAIADREDPEFLVVCEGRRA